VKIPFPKANNTARFAVDPWGFLRIALKILQKKKSFSRMHSSLQRKQDLGQDISIRAPGKGWMKWDFFKDSC
jgi:hypothetical protein